MRPRYLVKRWLSGMWAIVTRKSPVRRVAAVTWYPIQSHEMTWLFQKPAIFAVGEPLELFLHDG